VPKGTLEVGVYDPLAVTDSTDRRGNIDVSSRPPIESQQSSRDFRLGAATLGACASLLLHAILVTVLTWGGGHPHASSPKLPIPFNPARSSAPDDEPAMQLVSIEPAGQSMDWQAITSPPLTAVRLDATRIASNIVTLADDDAAAAPPVPGA